MSRNVPWSAGHRPHRPRPAADPAVRARRGMGDDRGVAADKRGNKTVKDLLLSLAVLAVVVAVIYLFVPHDSKASPAKSLKVDYTASLEQARRWAPYPVAAPEGLGKDWTPTGDTFDATDPHKVTWHLGFVSTDKEYVGVEQSNAAAAAFIAEVTLDGKRQGTGTVSAGGVQWEQWKSKRYTALVHQEQDHTTVVLGTGPLSQVTSVAALVKESGGAQK